MIARSTSARCRSWWVEMTDGRTREVLAGDVAEMGGTLRFFTGAVIDEQPEIVAAFRSSAVVAWGQS